MKPYLAPKTVVFIRKMPLSTKVYSSAGIVDNAGNLVSKSVDLHTNAIGVEEHSRPKNSARVVKVPYSASNLSNSGVSAMMFMNAWKKPACTRGKVFVLYTAHHTNQYLFSSKAHKIPVPGQRG